MAVHFGGDAFELHGCIAITCLHLCICIEPGVIVTTTSGQNLLCGLRFLYVITAAKACCLGILARKRQERTAHAIACYFCGLQRGRTAEQQLCGVLIDARHAGVTPTHSTRACRPKEHRADYTTARLQQCLRCTSARSARPAARIQEVVNFEASSQLSLTDRVVQRPRALEQYTTLVQL
jgi:hypothetical protein